MIEKNKDIPEWKLKTCANCDKEYLKGTGITKIELLDEKIVVDYPDWKYIRFEGIEEFMEKSYCVLCFCSKECCEEYFKEDNKITPFT